MISISVGPSAIAMTSPGLILSGLSNGSAAVGDTIGASLSDGSTFSSYAWGSSLGGAQYGASSVLTVPEPAAGDQIYLTAFSGVIEFSASVSIASIAAPPTTVIIPGLDVIDVQVIADLPNQPDLMFASDIDAILVEIA